MLGQKHPSPRCRTASRPVIDTDRSSKLSQTDPANTDDPTGDGRGFDGIRRDRTGRGGLGCDVMC
eukprot:3083711-Rhodomonas_salina.2